MPAEILCYFNINELRLLSNNPDKIAALERAGIHVVERIPCIVPAHESTARYLKTKKQKLGHLLD
jgi:GTP cyclohydrolase II